MHKYRKGITLIEIIFAVGILAFALIPVAGIMGQGIKGTKKNFRDITGIQMIEERLNRAISAKYSDLPIGDDQTTDIVLSNGQTIDLGISNKMNCNYKILLTVTEINTSFKYMPILVTNGSFDPSDESTWSFGANTNLNFDGASVATSRRVKELIARVEWNEPNGKLKKYSLKSYVAKLEE